MLFRIAFCLLAAWLIGVAGLYRDATSYTCCSWSA